jgi:amino acid permease
MTTLTLEGFIPCTTLEQAGQYGHQVRGSQTAARHSWPYLFFVILLPLVCMKELADLRKHTLFFYFFLLRTFPHY